MALTARCLAVAILLSARACGAAWVHPGVFVGTEQLATAAAAVAAGTQPVAAAFAEAVASLYAAKSYKPEGPPASGTIECGAYSMPDHGCGAEDRDGAAAFLQAVLFGLTSDAVYAANAVSILNAYGFRLKRYNNSNAPLQAAWGASKWTRAAELMRHLPGAGWAAADAAAFGAMLRGVVLPHIVNGSSANGK